MARQTDERTGKNRLVIWESIEMGGLRKEGCKKGGG